MIAAKTHRARAVDFRFMKADTGAEGVAVMFEITRGEDMGQMIAWRGWLTPDAARRTLEQLTHAGWVGEGPLSKLEGLGSTECLLDVEHEIQTQGENAGKRFARASWVKRLPSLDRQVKAPLAASTVDAIGLALGIKPRAPSTTTNGTSGGASSAPADNEPAADEVPF